MSKIDDMIVGIDDFLAGFSNGTYFMETCNQCEESMVADVRANLMEGVGSADELGASDVPLTPTYDADPFFKGNVEKAHAYKKWKMINFPESVPLPPGDRPNLYINGKFHSSLHGEYNAPHFEIVSSEGYGKEIMIKWNVSRFGMSQMYYETIFRPVMLDKLITAINDCLS